MKNSKLPTWATVVIVISFVLNVFFYMAFFGLLIYDIANDSYDYNYYDYDDDYNYDFDTFNKKIN